MVAFPCPFRISELQRQAPLIKSLNRPVQLASVDHHHARHTPAPPFCGGVTASARHPHAADYIVITKTSAATPQVVSRNPQKILSPVNHPTPPNLKKRQPRGFALVVSLMLMILLTVVAVSLLTLSSVALRTTNQGTAAATARNNARLAMMLALADLQASLGPDQSVSAPASSVIKNSRQPHLTGAWNSWQWTPTSTGSPAYSEKRSQFQRWLISNANPLAANSFDHPSTNPPTGINAVEMVGNLTNSQGITTSVIAGKIPVKNSKQPGKLAWAIFDESTKAAIDIPDSTNSTDSSLEIASRNAPSRFRADILDTKLAPLRNPENIISLASASIPVGITQADELKKRFHDITTGTVGLLTDTAQGGLKKDLTALLEPAPVSGTNPFPNGSFDSNTPYPNGFSTADGAPSWAYLQDHYRKYKNVTIASGTPSYNLNTSAARNTDLKVIRYGPSGKLTGLNPSPVIERMLPVIAKFQLVFSLVTHNPFEISGRRQFLNSSGDPKGYLNYGVVHLAYDPVITLYNPYDVTLDLSKTRVRIWDPPVGFRFRKIDKQAGTDTYFRPDGKFDGLAQLQIAGERNANARKCFTLVLADGTSQRLNATLQLKPGEVKVFSPRVENGWTFGQELASGYSMTSGTFFDWDQTKNFGNTDRRVTARYGRFGVESAPGWNVIAGLQTDHLSLAAGRDPQTQYGFEKGRTEGFVTMRVTDEVVAEVKPIIRSGTAATQFQVDVMAGLTTATDSGKNINSDTFNTEEIADTLRSYRFNFNGTDPSEELSADPANPIISRSFQVGAILQPDTGKQTGYKKPFAMLEMSARTTKDLLTDNKPWLYNNFIVEGGEQNSNSVGLAHQSYDLRLLEMSSFDSFPGGIDIDPDTFRGYFGASGSVSEGSSFVNMLHTPLAPAASLGNLVHANLASSSLLPRVMHPFGNSRAHPLIPADAIASRQTNLMMDHSYLLNHSLWDSYYFSSISDYQGGILPQNRTIKDVLGGVLNGTQPALNSRITRSGSAGEPSEIASRIGGLGSVERSRQIAAHIAVRAPFNVNSTSVDAWRAVLSSLRDRPINGVAISGTTGDKLSAQSYSNDQLTPFVRGGKPLSNSSPPSGLLWGGYRALTDNQIEELAQLIVNEITTRGAQDSAPSLSLAEFVNRRPGSASDLHSLAGLLQTAIDKSSINDSYKSRDSKSLNSASISGKRKIGVQTEQVMNGFSAEGAPSMLTQGDLMAALAPVVTVRGDTFKIRSYGEATALDGTTVLARAWCETIVQRVPDFVDPTDAAETVLTSLKSKANQSFGRRFNIVSFRWLNDREI
ncbi:MAG: hypothetical protein RLZZ245_1094 [Verrucomicrobiota bacterium]